MSKYEAIKMLIDDHSKTFIYSINCVVYNNNNKWVFSEVKEEVKMLLIVF